MDGILTAMQDAFLLADDEGILAAQAYCKSGDSVVQ
jgi:hypothetical protein